MKRSLGSRGNTSRIFILFFFQAYFSSQFATVLFMFCSLFLNHCKHTFLYYFSLFSQEQKFLILFNSTMGELFQNGWCICFFQVAQTNINFFSFSFGDPKPQIHGEDNSGILFSSGEAPNPEPRQKQMFPVQLFCFIFKFSVNMKTFEKLSFFFPSFIEV